jgi:hypothetical protein
MRERPHDELIRLLFPRFKVGLDTPLHIRLYGENKRITFAPPLWYDALVSGCLFGGFGMAVLAFLRGGFQIGMFPYMGFFLWTAVGLSGVWAAISNERMSCDPRKGTYARLEGSALWKKLTRGYTNELDALVLLTEKYPLVDLTGKTVVAYRLVLHWKGSKMPLLIVDERRRTNPSGTPLNHSAGDLLYMGSRVAKALGIPFYDNSYFHSPCPIRI